MLWFCCFVLFCGHTYPSNGASRELFDSLHKPAGGLGQILKESAAADVFLPAGQRLVDDLHSFQHCNQRRERKEKKRKEKRKGKERKERKKKRRGESTKTKKVLRDTRRRNKERKKGVLKISLSLSLSLICVCVCELRKTNLKPSFKLYKLFGVLSLSSRWHTSALCSHRGMG